MNENIDEIVGRKNKSWKQEEDSFLIKNFNTLPIKEISETLKRSVSAVGRRAWELGVKAPKKETIQNSHKYICVSYQDQVIYTAPTTTDYDGLLSIIKNNLHQIRPALIRGEKITIQLE